MPKRNITPYIEVLKIAFENFNEDDYAALRAAVRAHQAVIDPEVRIKMVVSDLRTDMQGRGRGGFPETALILASCAEIIRAVVVAANMPDTGPPEDRHGEADNKPN